MTSWRKSEMIRESPPRPSASNTPEKITPADDTKNPSEINRSASIPARISSASAWNILRMMSGIARETTVPTSISTAAEIRL